MLPILSNGYQYFTAVSADAINGYVYFSDSSKRIIQRRFANASGLIFNKNNMTSSLFILMTHGATTNALYIR